MKPENVSYYVFEGELARQERHVKRMWVLVLIMFAALVISNVSWIMYENSFEDTVTVTQDSPAGNNNYIGRNGDITNGAANSDENQTP